MKMELQIEMEKHLNHQCFSHRLTRRIYKVAHTRFNWKCIENEL